MTPEYVWIYENCDNKAVGGDDILRSFLAKILSNIPKKLPEEILQDVFDNCLFIWPTKPGQFFTADYVKGRHVIHLSVLENPVDHLGMPYKDEPTPECVILHEVGHYKLKHKMKCDIPPTEWDKQEKAANEWAKQWLEVP